MKPIIALNLKVYKESLGEGGLKLCEIASEVSLLTGVRIIIAPQHIDLREACKRHSEIFAQHTDPVLQGAFTGTMTAEAVKEAGCKGSLINHSEHRIPMEDIATLVKRLRELGLESIVCTKDADESALVAKFKPDYIAVEPPELIGSGISVSTAKPEVVTSTVQKVKAVANVPVLCGAGVTTPSDVKKAIELGSEGILLASAFVRSSDPRTLLMQMAEQIK